ncbi:hypothetical protein ABEW49_18980 [Bacillus anthracis]|uniref:hypothetical protein n=1 Tax=Bacillus anthracis TaxID=1392 RepID=UPI003D2381B1
MKKFLSIITMALMVAFSFSFSNSTQAAQSTPLNKVPDQIKLIKEHSTTLTEAQVQKTLDIVQKAIASNQIEVKGDINKLDFANASGYKFDKEQDNTTIITIPFTDNSKTDVSSLNNVTVALDVKLEILEYSEIKIEETKDTAKSTVYANGEKVGSNEIKKGGQDYELKTGYIDRVNACMKKFGVTPETAALAISTCGTVCTVSLGTLCLPCLGIFSAAGGGVIIGCFMNS